MNLRKTGRLDNRQPSLEVNLSTYGTLPVHFQCPGNCTRLFYLSLGNSQFIA
jgi:hypothetical protein